MDENGEVRLVQNDEDSAVYVLDELKKLNYQFNNEQHIHMMMRVVQYFVM